MVDELVGPVSNYLLLCQFHVSASWMFSKHGRSSDERSDRRIARRKIDVLTSGACHITSRQLLPRALNNILKTSRREQGVHTRRPLRQQTLPVKRVLDIPGLRSRIFKVHHRMAVSPVLELVGKHQYVHPFEDYPNFQASILIYKPPAAHFESGSNRSSVK